MAHYLGVGLAMLVTGIAPSLIVPVGEVTRAWKRIGPIINKVIAERSPTTTIANNMIAQGGDPALRLVR